LIGTYMLLLLLLLLVCCSLLIALKFRFTSSHSIAVKVNVFKDDESSVINVVEFSMKSKAQEKRDFVELTESHFFSEFDSKKSES